MIHLLILEYLSLSPLSPLSRLPFRTADKSPKFTALVAKDAGCGDDPRKPCEKCMLALPWQSVLAGAVKAETDLLVEAGQFLSLFQPYSPTVGTPELKVQPMVGFLTGASLDVPTVMGSVTQEGLIFVYEAFPTKPVSRVEEDALLALIFGVDHVEEVLKQYPRDPNSEDMRNHTAPIVTDALFHCPIRHIALRLAQQQKNGSRPTGDLWAYRFDHVLSFGSKFWGKGASAICVGNVCHGEELPLVFQPPLAQINGSYDSEEMALSKSMQRYWANFANDADPNDSKDDSNGPNDSSGLSSPSSSSSSSVAAGNDVTGTANAKGGLLAWPKLEAKNESMIRFMTPGNVVDVASDRSKCALWDSLGYEWVLRHS